jgi:hypothetical protein
LSGNIDIATISLGCVGKDIVILIGKSNDKTIISINRDVTTVIITSSLSRNITTISED